MAYLFALLDAGRVCIDMMPVKAMVLELTCHAKQRRYRR
jgi:hypothetical protein